VLYKREPSRDKSRDMMRSRISACLACAAFGVTALTLALTSPRAWAHGDVEADRPATEAGSAPRAPAGEHAEHAEASEKESEHEAEEKRFAVWLDAVLGWGHAPFAAQNLPATGNPQLTYSRYDQTATDVQSFILGGSVEVVPHIGVEVRVPLTFATFSPPGSQSRSATAFGNIELAGEYEAEPARGLELIVALGVALPTAQGTAVPDDLAQAPASQVDSNAYDRWSLSRAASFARGYEENALFEPKRLGIIPKVALRYTLGGFVLEPFVKVENLIGTSTTLAAGYVGELVGGATVGYRIIKPLELGLRGWVNVGFAGADEDKVTAVAIEPRVLAYLGPVSPYAGVIIPVAGPPSDASFFGVRLGAAVKF
jgi:hypothetical protein